MSAQTSFAALGTTATVVVSEERTLPQARCLLAEETSRIDRACSRFRDDSELTHANSRAGETVHVTALLAAAVRVALDAAASTDGLVVPTLGRPLCAVGYDVTFTRVLGRAGWAVRDAPHDPETWRLVELEDDRRLLRVPPGAALDLGATAKAFAADRAAARIADETRSGVLVSLGGDIAVAGRAPAGGWAVGIADDHAAAPGRPVIGLSAGGLATSSTVVRSWPTDRGRAHHILDPRSGSPAVTPWQTVSVAAATCVDANVAATGAIVVGTDAPAWLEARGVHARLVASSGETVLVGDWPAEEAAA